MRAHSLTLSECGDPNCGVHIIANDEQERPICEIIISQEAMREHITIYQAILYKKATENND